MGHLRHVKENEDKVVDPDLNPDYPNPLFLSDGFSLQKCH